VQAEEAAKHPDKRIEVWTTDEHRLGLKPIHRRVWAPIGERPIALGHHRYEWLYVTAFVAPTSGETVWFLSNGIDKAFFAKLLEAFARETGAGCDRIIVLQLDNAGWHTPENLDVPDGIRLVYQPAYTPELQPAEHLWSLVDEPLANKHFDTIDDLDAVVAMRCCDLHRDRNLIAQHANFHWWPKSINPS
jgi:transposase